ncbi:MAG: GAF domain-containing protein, partial [Anaerolineaceae bacterium]|nr:GAF domain-containing protein [Anaerolineaceae bacterium]
MQRSQRNAEPDWKHLLHLSELLANQASPVEQCQLIKQITSQFLSAEVRVWLAFPAYSRWGNAEIETLPKAEATPLTHTAFTERKTAYSYQNSKSHTLEITTTPGDQPPVSLAIPLVTRGIYLGIMQVDANKDQFFSKQDVIFAEGIALNA